MGVTKLTVTKPAKAVAKTRQCSQCRVTFPPNRPKQKYCSDACRQKAHRQRHKTPKQGAVVVCCQRCGDPFRTASKRAKYCPGSCRTLAARARREAAIEALAAWQGMEQSRAADIVEIGGMKRATAALAAGGFCYDEQGRRWVASMAIAAAIRTREQVPYGGA